jgi:hypothetical protein
VGADPHLYNPCVVGPGVPEVWITEGEFNALVLVELGYDAIATAGSSNALEGGDPKEKKKNPERFRKSWSYLFDHSTVIVAFDNDESGRRDGRPLARALRGHVFEWEEEHNDEGVGS